jgi:hypothetical protein
MGEKDVKEEYVSLENKLFPTTLKFLIGFMFILAILSFMVGFQTNLKSLAPCNPDNIFPEFFDSATMVTEKIIDNTMVRINSEEFYTKLCNEARILHFYLLSFGLLGLLAAISAIGMIYSKKWAKILSILLLAVFILFISVTLFFTDYFLIMGLKNSDPVNSNVINSFYVASIGSLLFVVFSFFYLLFSKKVREVFR